MDKMYEYEENLSQLKGELQVWKKGDKKKGKSPEKKAFEQQVKSVNFES